MTKELLNWYFYIPVKLSLFPKYGLSIIRLRETKKKIEKLNIPKRYSAYSGGYISKATDLITGKVYKNIYVSQMNGNTRAKIFSLHTHDEIVNLYANRKLTIEAVLSWSREWASLDAVLITPSNKYKR